ncbi:MAG: Na+/proline symporter [Chlorobi bacterium OLB5]|nr:MAG: Na+/proline symporter [Chlorobi bacterium OLB5]
MNFSYLDIIIVVLYLAGVTSYGIIKGGKQKSARDYFVSEKAIPWWAVCFAIVATETSALTFISVPGVAYAGNLNFLQIAIGYILGRIVVSWFLLPKYYEGELLTAYAYLGKRFGAKTKNTASAVFMVTRVFADGVRLYATAIPLALLLKGWNIFPAAPDWQIYTYSIIIIAVITLAYTYLGGVRAVIWTDVIQMFIYIGGGLLAVYVLSGNMTVSYSEAISQLSAKGKLNFFDLSLDFNKPYTLIASILGGGFLSMASHGTDQLIVQRLLTTNSLKSSQKALITSGFIVFFQFALFLFVGSLLYIFFNGEVMKSDEVFPKFIINYMPSGVSGIIIAGLLAAAMSTLSGSISALSSTLVEDIYKPYFGKNKTERQILGVSKIIALIWCGVLILSAFLFMNSSQAVVVLGLSIASFTYGGLLGTFLLGVFFKRISQVPAIIGFLCGITGMIFIIYFTKIAWTWYTLIGVVITIITANIIQLFINQKSLKTETEKV